MPTSDLPVNDLLRKVDPHRELAPCGIKQITLGPGAVTTLAQTVADLLAQRGARTARPMVALLVDRVPMTRCGADLKDLVARQLGERFTMRQVILDDGKPELHVVDDVIAAATRGVQGADAVVALGGGTISDIGKLAAAQGDSVLVSVQTAASVDGYTDDVSVVLRDGVKRTVPSRWPDAVVADAETIAEAPAVMNRSGFGEMTSMLTAPADWLLASMVGADSRYAQGPIRLLEIAGEGYDAWAPGVRAGDADALAALTRALAIRGVVSGISGTTAVLSGAEHLVSHMLDQHQSAHHLPVGLHGAQVGAAAVVAAAAWELLFDRLATEPAPEIDGATIAIAPAGQRVQRAFSALGPAIAEECWRDYKRKLATVVAGYPRLRAVLHDWHEHAPKLRRLVHPSAQIAAALRSAGAAAGPAELTPQISPALWRWAVANCALMRNRFTVIDLLTLLGWWTDADVDEVLARAGYAATAEMVG